MDDFEIPEVDLKRFLEQVLAEPLEEAELMKAHEELIEMVMHTALLKLWRKGEIKMRWDIAEGELSYQLAHN
jgi:hypothetical protein